MPDLHALNPPQRLAVTTTEGPVLILAGAGTGKTRVITFRIAHLIERGVAPGAILGVTFTNKAAREMLERVNRLVPGGGRRGPGEAPQRPTVCTFHSLGVRLLRQHIERLGYKPNFVIYDESDQLGAVKKVLSHVATGPQTVDARAVLALISRFKNGGGRAGDLGSSELAALAEHVRERYDRGLQACNAVDFDDLLGLTLRLFREHPDVLEACRARYRYVMVDEYQDTNAAQFELVHALTRVHRNLCVVGDDDQSIYGWRGAEIANLLDLERHYPEVKVVKLEQNYRSTSTILTAANALIRQNLRRRGKNLWSERGVGAPIALFTMASDEEEARTVVEEIEFARHARRVPWAQQAVLFRTNNQSRPIETALRKAGVRYRLVGGQSFFDRREVRDLLAYLKVMVNPHDDVSLLRIANVPARGLSEATMERLLAASHERHGSVFAAMQNPAIQATLPARARECLEHFVAWVERTRARLDDPGRARGSVPLKDWTLEWLQEIGYEADVRRSEKQPETAENRVENLRNLVASLDGADAPAGAPLRDRLLAALEQLTLDTEREEEADPGDAVTLITMHSCKGLEFPHVFIVGLEDGLLPHTRSKEEGTLDEERRLFYVAITRAMETLTLSHCGLRVKYGQPVPCHPSPFLKELPPELIERAEKRARTPVSRDEAKRLFGTLRASLG